MALEEKDYSLLATWHDINTKFGVLYEIQKVENSNCLVNILNHSISSKFKIPMGGKRIPFIPGHNGVSKPTTKNYKTGQNILTDFIHIL